MPITDKSESESGAIRFHNFYPPKVMLYESTMEVKKIIASPKMIRIMSKILSYLAKQGINTYLGIELLQMLHSWLNPSLRFFPL